MNVFVIDANTVVSAALNQLGTPQRAIAAARAKGTVALSRPVFQELVAVLSRPKFARFLPDSQRFEVLVALTSAALWMEPSEPVKDCRDPGDNKYFELALAARAAVIVSGDKDLLVLNPWRGTLVLTPAQFLQWLSDA